MISDDGVIIKYSLKALYTLLKCYLITISYCATHGYMSSRVTENTVFIAMFVWQVFFTLK